MKEKFKLLFLNFGSVNPVKRQPGIVRLSTFLLDFFAFVVIQRSQKIDQLVIAGIVPMKLHTLAQHETHFAQYCEIGGMGEKNMQGGNL